MNKLLCVLAAIGAAPLAVALFTLLLAGAGAVGVVTGFHHWVGFPWHEHFTFDQMTYLDYVMSGILTVVIGGLWVGISAGLYGFCREAHHD